MQISVSAIKRFGLCLPFAMLMGASSLPAAPAAAAGDPLPDPNLACSPLTAANLQAVIDPMNADINGPATQDINSVPNTPGASLTYAQSEHDELVSARDMLVQLRDTVVLPNLRPGQAFVTNLSVAENIQEVVAAATHQVETAETHAWLSATANKTLPPRYSYVAMVQLMPALVKFGADGGACVISLVRPTA